MTGGRESSDSSTRTLTASQRWSVLRMAGVAIAMTLTLPLYYTLVAFAPGIAGFVPALVVHVLMAVGLLAGFPATLVYAHKLEQKTIERESEEPPEYGVNDRWERQNL